MGEPISFQNVEIAFDFVSFAPQWTNNAIDITDQA